ncbi:hypothetical protein [Paracoccus jeotgali]|uniref:hypothetical protein n=1 Tax=Paracoccus jeotgali TaxID=2065379 RepID=UPI0028A589C4|nr:hypothetical protein [Paracoccus jeotgali]
MNPFLAVAAVAFSAQALLAQQVDGVLIRCGASSGHAFFLRDDLTNPEEPKWERDSISAGKILLVRYGDQWDILFDDSLHAYGYRQDGATVLPLIEKGHLLTVAAIGAQYIDTYTFDFLDKRVAWTSNKVGPIVPKVAAYEARCD